jgi:hypothetical protein
MHLQAARAVRLTAARPGVQAELRDHPDEIAQKYLDGAKQRLERNRAGG